MQSNKEELKKTLLDLLLEDKEFRHAVAGAIGYKEILDRIAKVEEDMNKRFLDMEEQMNARFLKLEEDMNKRFLDMEERFNARFLKVEEEIRDLREEMNKLRKDLNDLRRDMLEGFKRHDEEFARVWKSIEDLRKDLNDLRKDMQEGFKRVDKRFERMDVKISALGARWGIMNEQSVREALKGMVGEELGYTISEWVAYDDEGYVYGYPSRVQLDIVVSDGKVIALEITSHVKKSDPIMLKKKAELYRKKEGKEIGKLVFVTPFIDDDAIEICSKFGIDVYTPS
ncbi:MAG: DUF3782 domain-containing protein [Candidatus Nitrosocaldus sp.]